MTTAAEWLIKSATITPDEKAEIAAAVWQHATGAAVAIRLAEAWGRLGLDPSKPLVTGETSITFGDIVMALAESSGNVTLTRQ